MMSLSGMIKGVCSIALCGCLVAGPAQAAETSSVSNATVDLAPATTGSLGSVKPSAPMNLPSSPSNPAWMARYVLSLLVIGVLMIGGFMLLRRVQSRLLSGSGAGGAPVMRMVGRMPLDQRNTLVIVQVRGEELVLATSASGARLITKHQPPDPSPAEAT